MKKQLLMSSVLLVLSVPSYASNFYLLADIGQGKIEIDADGAAVSNTDTAIGFGGGYKLNKNFAVEVAYRDMGEWSESYYDDLGDGDYSSGSFSMAASALQLSIVGTFELGEKASIYGRLGAADLELELGYDYADRSGSYYDADSSSESESKTKAIFGMGLGYAFTPSVSLRAEYSQIAEWEGINVSATTVGLTYQF